MFFIQLVTRARLMTNRQLSYRKISRDNKLSDLLNEMQVS